MKVYIPIKEAHGLLNPYVATLFDAMKSKHKDVEIIYGEEFFWSIDVFDCDIVHIQWPDILLGKKTGNIKSCEDVKKRLEDIKRQHISIFSTCHNLAPHYSQLKEETEIYNIVYQYSDILLHLGKYSFDLLQQSLPHVKHLILPHHIYDEKYGQQSYAHGIKKLGLDKTKRYVICFGAFRSSEERKLVYQVSKLLNNHNIEILAPSFTTVSPPRGVIHKLYTSIKKKYYKTKYPHLHIKGDVVTDEELPYYYAVSDVAFIQRRKILNSGNVPMALMMGKVVVGPDVGNIGELLKSLNNPVFNVNSTPKEIYDIILDSIDLAYSGLGKKNQKYAYLSLSSSVVADQLFNYYLKNKKKS